MATVFSTVLPLVLYPVRTADQMYDLCRRPPLERLARSIDALQDSELSAEWPAILDIYEDFLSSKEAENVDAFLEGGESKETVQKHAQQLSTFLHKALTHDRIGAELRRYLVL